MNAPNETIVAMLRTGARAFAAHAAETLLERHPDLVDQYGRSAFGDWREHLVERVLELAAALDVNDAELFAGQLRWAGAAFEARQVSPEHVVESVRALRDALIEDLADHQGGGVATFIDQALGLYTSPVTPDPMLVPDNEYSVLALQYLEGVLSGDRRRAIDLVLAALDAGMPIEAAYCTVLLPAQAEVGRMWHVGEITIPEEHFITETTRTTMSLLLHRAAPPTPPVATVLVSAVEGDRHDIGVRAVSDLFEIGGFRAICLGSDVPIRDVAQAVIDFEPDVLVLAATMSLHLSAVRSAMVAARHARTGQHLHVVVGGPAFRGSADRATRLGADAFAASPGDAVRAARQLLGMQ